MPPPNVPTKEGKFSFALVAGREWQGVGGVRCFAGRSVIFKEPGWREVGMWEWGWASEVSVGGESGRGDARGVRKLLGEEGQEGWVGFLRGPAEVFWKRVSLFPDPLFLSHRPRHGTLRAVVVLAPARHCLLAPSALRLGERTQPGGDKTPEISVPAAREDGEKDEASAGSAGESLPLLPPPLAEGCGIREQGWALPVPPCGPFPTSLDEQECSLQPAREAPASSARALDQLSPISKYYIQNYITEFMSSLA